MGRRDAVRRNLMLRYVINESRTDANGASELVGAAMPGKQ